jgi:predicted PurR-regulated permease PerM
MNLKAPLTFSAQMLETAMAGVSDRAPAVSEAALAPLLYLAVVTVEGQFLTPTLMGKRLELNPFAVFLAIAFCAWLWGPLGAFLAVPMLMVISVILGHAFEEEKPDLPD